MNTTTHGRHRRPETYGVEAPSTATASAGSRTRAGAVWRLRPRTVRAKIVSVLMVPVVALMALWGLAAVTEVRNVIILKHVTVVDEQVGVPAGHVAQALAAERTATAQYLAQPQTRSALPPNGKATLEPQTSSTDSSVTAVRDGGRNAAVATTELDPSVQGGINTLLADLDGLPALRTRIDAHQIAPADAYDAYSAMISDARAVDSTLASVRSGHQRTLGTDAALSVGLLAILASLLISVRIGRGLVLELVTLRNSALDLAGRRLPAAIGRLRSGQAVDLETEAPLPTAGRTIHGGDEVGQVADALAIVQRAAIEAAVERAEVVSGVAGVFLNLARRSQGLVHRQLMLLDAMERREDDPAELEDLFRLDHLATRMRRHAEGLIILSGAAPGRAWRRPVPLMDVARAAAAEVEDFDRVDVRRMPRVHVVGSAVADLIHLVAELVENGTMFSPPHSRVTVQAEMVGSGCAVEVEDRGLGMGDEALAEANRHIAHAQQADLFENDRLGLFVISRLARRHGIRVSLRRSDYGGTTAVVLLPQAALIAADEADAPDESSVTELASVMGLLPRLRANGVPAREAKRVNGVRHDHGLDYDEDHVGGPGDEDRGRGAGQDAEHDYGHDRGRGRDHEPDPGVGRSGDRERHRDPDGERERRNGDGGPLLLIGENGLPQRRRQASLAPQLRDDRVAASKAAEAPEASEEPTSALPSPDAIRATMAAFQRGWTRGRDAEHEGASLGDAVPDATDLEESR